MSLISGRCSAWISSSPFIQPELALTARAVRSLTIVSFNPSIPASCLDSSSSSCDRISRSNRSVDPKRSRRSSMAGGTAADRGDTTKSLETVVVLKIRGMSDRKTVHRVLTFAPHHDENLQQLRTIQPFLFRHICFSRISKNAPAVNVKVGSAVACLVQTHRNYSLVGQIQSSPYRSKAYCLPSSRRWLRNRKGGRNTDEPGMHDSSSPLTTTYHLLLPIPQHFHCRDEVADILSVLDILHSQQFDQ